MQTYFSVDYLVYREVFFSLYFVLTGSLELFIRFCTQNCPQNYRQRWFFVILNLRCVLDCVPSFCMWGRVYQIHPPDSTLVFLISRVWVQVLVVSLVSQRKIILCTTHHCFVLRILGTLNHRSLVLGLDVNSLRMHIIITINIEQ